MREQKCPDKASGKGKADQAQNCRRIHIFSLYEVADLIKKATGLLESYDMTSEACLAKLMWVLEQTHDINEIKKLFYSPIGNDILRDVED